MLTRQYRFATRGIEMTVHTAQQAIDIAGGIVGGVAGGVADRLGLRHGHGHDEADVVSGEVVPERDPRADAEPARAPEPPTPSPTPPAPTSAPAPGPAPPAPTSAPPTAAAPTVSPPAPAPPAPAPAEPAPPAPPPPEPAPAEPAHVSTEPELVEEVAEPGAEDGAGAQIHVREPWPGYRSLKARDVIARLTSATREELATVELFELAHANRKSVVVAAQRALKKASPPR